MAPVGRVLVLGGQRSGKSRYAEGLVMAGGLSPVYLATAAAGDDEMRNRINDHRKRRGDAWRTVEEPLDLPGALARQSTEKVHILVECLTLWVANLMGAGMPIGDSTRQLLDALPLTKGPVVLVSGEVGLGIVAADPLSRSFADALGALNQEVAAVVDHVVLITAGLPLVLKAGRPHTELVL